MHVNLISSGRWDELLMLPPSTACHC